MSLRYQILCSTKEEIRGELTITHIGGKNPLGEFWKLKVEQAIQGLQTETYEFFINRNGQSFPVYTIKSQSGFQIQAGNSEKNLIFELPDCPL